MRTRRGFRAGLLLAVSTCAIVGCRSENPQAFRTPVGDLRGESQKGQNGKAIFRYFTFGDETFWTQRVACGVYMLRLEAAGHRANQKLVMLN